MAQPKTTQRRPARAGMNREQIRRGGPVAPAAGRSPAPVGAVGGRGRRGGANLFNFVREVRTELRKVVWPTSRETANLTVVVLALSIAVGLFLGAFDFIFQEFFRLLIGGR